MRLTVLLLAVTVLATQQPSAISAWSPQAPQASAPLPSGVIAGTVVDAANGQPIDSAVVHIAPATGAQPHPHPLQMTDPKGRFLFANLPAGSYTLRASRTGYSEGAYGRDADSGISQTPIALETGQRFITATIALDKPSAISGLVTDEAGEPMVNVFVRALRLVMMSGVERVAAGRVTATDDRGAYRLSGLAPGPVARQRGTQQHHAETAAARRRLCRRERLRAHRRRVSPAPRTRIARLPAGVPSRWPHDRRRAADHD